MGQGFTQDLGGLVTCRALMGFFESGFVPGDWSRTDGNDTF